MTSLFNYIGKKNFDFGNVLQVLGSTKYVEPFGGSYQAGLNTMNKENSSVKFIFNDVDLSIYLIWKEARKNIFDLVDEYYRVCKLFEGFGEFDEIMHYIDTASTSDTNIAACNMFLANSLRFKGGSRFDFEKDSIYKTYMTHDWFLEMLDKLPRLSLYNLDYRELLKLEDSPSSFMFIDPPYYIKNTNVYYGTNCSYFYHKELAKILSTVKANWILSYNDCDYINELYKDYRKLPYKYSSYRSEVYIYNFNIDERALKEALRMNLC